MALRAEVSVRPFTPGSRIWRARCEASAWGALWASETRLSTKGEIKGDTLFHYSDSTFTPREFLMGFVSDCSITAQPPLDIKGTTLPLRWRGRGLPGLSRWVTFLASAQVHLPGSSVNPILLVFYWGFLEVYFRQDWLAHWPLVVQLFPVQSHFFLDMGGCGWKCQPFNQVFGFSDKQMNSTKSQV